MWQPRLPCSLHQCMCVTSPVQTSTKCECVNTSASLYVCASAVRSSVVDVMAHCLHCSSHGSIFVFIFEQLCGMSCGNIFTDFKFCGLHERPAKSLPCAKIFACTNFCRLGLNCKNCTNLSQLKITMNQVAHHCVSQSVPSLPALVA